MNVAEVVDFFDNTKTYKQLCNEMRKVLSLEKEVAAKKEELRKKILEQSEGECMQWGIKVSRVMTKGAIDYKAMAKEWYSEEAFEEIAESYRKEASESWRVVSY